MKLAKPTLHSLGICSHLLIIVHAQTAVIVNARMCSSYGTMVYHQLSTLWLLPPPQTSKLSRLNLAILILCLKVESVVIS